MGYFQEHIQRTEKSARKILKFFDKEIENAPCSEKHHLNIVGGLKMHLENVYSIAKNTFPNDNVLIFLALIHDIGKARVYKITEKGIEYIQPDVDHILYTITMLNEYGVELNNEELNAIQFHHGGWSGFKGSMGELAIKLHYCDMVATFVIEK